MQQVIKPNGLFSSVQINILKLLNSYTEYNKNIYVELKAIYDKDQQIQPASAGCKKCHSEVSKKLELAYSLIFENFCGKR